MKINAPRALQVLAPVALLASTFATQAQAKPKAKIAWQPTMEKALALSKSSKKPLMVDFYATWCGPCKLLDSKIYTNPVVIKESRNWINVKVDGEKRPDLMRKYNLSGFPSILYMAPSGKILKKQGGIVVPDSAPKNASEATLLRLISKDMANTMKTLRARAKGPSRSA